MAAASEKTRPTVASLGCLSQGSVDVAPNPWLAAAAQRAGVPLDDRQRSRFELYRQTLIDWNRRTNLTAVTESDEIDRRLILDALLAVPTLDRLLSSHAASTPKLVDIGSGAGFPGLVIKIARPHLDVTLIEATGNKVRFLSHLIAALGLDGVVAQHARAEDLGHHAEYRGVYDIVTARAVASLPALIELAVPFLRIGGHGLFPKGRDLAVELAAGERAASLLGARVLSADLVPETETRLVQIAKIDSTPARYPRRAGIPAREPLGVAKHPQPPLVPSGSTGGR